MADMNDPVSLPSPPVITPTPDDGIHDKHEVKAFMEWLVQFSEAAAKVSQAIASPQQRKEE